MDIKWILLLMAILYILPEIFKRRRPKKYEYPEIPGKPADHAPAPPQPELKTTAFLQKEWHQPASLQPKPATSGTISAPLELIDHPENVTAWHGAISRQTIINGFIFAEILQPPRALRPLERLNRSCYGKKR
ncbi:MAG: hypothetical protein N2491_09275 [Negativicutes bacterium]|nr:hypothetical protein [Negativicutes bacterium]